MAESSTSSGGVFSSCNLYFVNRGALSLSRINTMSQRVREKGGQVIEDITSTVIDEQGREEKELHPAITHIVVANTLSRKVFLRFLQASSLTEESISAGRAKVLHDEWVTKSSGTGKRQNDEAYLYQFNESAPGAPSSASASAAASSQAQRSRPRALMSAKEEDEPAKKKARTGGGAESASASAAASSPALKVLTWNIDVDIDEERLKALVALIRKEKPDIVCLQEVTPDRATHLSAWGGEHSLEDEYHVLRGGTRGGSTPAHAMQTHDMTAYAVSPLASLPVWLPAELTLNVTLVFKRSLTVIDGSLDTHWYPRGQIGKRGDEKLRHLCHVRVRPVDGTSGGTELLLCNTHLDSGSPSNDNQFRREQLKDLGQTIIK
ncbi:unnamed protein product [Vitrella brassicaformis CCMP3155]|uniref:BRCT domain-containing protein n=1 Tax=Vitrella brassicaformis (strain CCMP3155) TaxID=1169540 RepID=A0A0G4GJU1_VITBC|nr:unnamed protein product [Vitrella brassicaformis CCMP3155]|eukprot:CEM30196.1 unnamed protein product [Vitrella brassicaformis CCMP3155]